MRPNRGRQVAVLAADADDARLLALELAGLAPARGVDPVALRLVLEPGEFARRATLVRLAWWQGAWVGGVQASVVVTDRRLIVRMPDASLGSLWWGSVVGFEADVFARPGHAQCGAPALLRRPRWCPRDRVCRACAPLASSSLLSRRSSS